MNVEFRSSFAIPLHITLLLHVCLFFGWYKPYIQSRKRHFGFFCRSVLGNRAGGSNTTVTSLLTALLPLHQCILRISSHSEKNMGSDLTAVTAMRGRDSSSRLPQCPKSSRNLLRTSINLRQTRIHNFNTEGISEQAKMVQSWGLY